MADDDREYIPGKCNIGAGEIRKRRVLGWIGLAAAIVLWTAFIVLKSPALWRLLLFVPAVLAALGFIQSKQGFCVKYGFDGAYKFGRNVGRPYSPEQTEFHHKDRRTALRIIGFSALIGLATAAAGYLLPL